MASAYLQHHGILGQKWGIRRFQNKDGSLTAAGEKRYNADVEGAKKRVSDAKENYRKASEEYSKKTKGGLVYDQAATDKLSKAAGKLNWEKERFSNEKTKERMNSQSGNISKHRQKLIDEYKQEGMSQEEAEVAAYKRARTEKILAVAATVTVAAAAAYVAKRAYDKRVDKLIPSGTLLQNISVDGNKGVQDAFYASFNKMDNTKYRGIYGTQLGRAHPGSDIFETKIKVKDGLNLASERSGINTLSELIKNDKSYAAALEQHLSLSSGSFSEEAQKRVAMKGLASLKQGKVDANVYAALNLSLANHATPAADRVSKGFYDALKSKGYDAILDINDKKYSGYMSKSPIIVFNGSMKTAVDSVRSVGADERAKDYAKGYRNIYLKAIAPMAAAGAASLGATYAGVKALNSRQRNKIVSDYKKEHPNTQLSYDEILNNYYGS